MLDVARTRLTKTGPMHDSQLDRTPIPGYDIYKDVAQAGREEARNSSLRVHNLSRSCIVLHLQPRRFLFSDKKRGWVSPVVLVLVSAVVVLVFLEFGSSWLQAHTLSGIARSMQFSLAQGPSSAIHYPHRGPYDYRLGYASLPKFAGRLEASGYEIAKQAHDSNSYMLLTGLGLYPMYREKNQAGLQILDGSDHPIYTVHYPARIYSNASEIPPLLVNTSCLSRTATCWMQNILTLIPQWNGKAESCRRAVRRSPSRPRRTAHRGQYAGHAIGEDSAFPERQDPLRR